MKFDKKVIESGAVAAFSLVLAFSAVPGPYVPANANSNSQTVELITIPKKVYGTNNVRIAVKEQQQRNIVTASAPAALPKKTQQVSSKQTSKKSTNGLQESVQQTANELKQSILEESVTQVSEETVQEIKEEKKSKKKNRKEARKNKKNTKKEETKNQIIETASQEVSPWSEKLMANVEEYLNIRTEASEEAELAGKLHKGAGAEILEQGEEWTKIRSGNVEGYVKNEFCVTGLEAEALAHEVGTTYATAVTGGVRVRESASSQEDVKILDVLEEEGKIKVDKDAETVEGWVPVKVDDQIGYVSEEYVMVELELGKAISIEEEQAAIAAAEAEQAAKEAAESQSSQQSGGSQQKAAVSASYDDVTLLGALIQCEAGSESYEGQLAVGAVVMNRLRAGYAGSISGVIYQSGQFTPASSGALASVLSSGVSGSCLSAAQEAINGADNVNGATSFRRVGSADGLVIGNHVFF